VGLFLFWSASAWPSCHSTPALRIGAKEDTAVPFESPTDFSAYFYKKNTVDFLFPILFGLVFFFSFLYFVPINLWIIATFSGVRVALMELVFMKIRRVNVPLLVNCMITLTKAGVPYKTTELETHALAGGDVAKLTVALVKAKNAGITNAFKALAARQLAGEDVSAISFAGGDSVREKVVAKIQNELTEAQVQEVAVFMEKFK
jgi:uncharacterized protein YqfA (UPF0365 family)